MVYYNIMKVKYNKFVHADEVCKWAENVLFDWHNELELISIVKDRGEYVVFYKVHEEEDKLL